MGVVIASKTGSQRLLWLGQSSGPAGREILQPRDLKGVEKAKNGAHNSPDNVKKMLVHCPTFSRITCKRA